MRLLVVSWYMPPFNTMGALRVGKLCKYLHGRGHDVRVLAAADIPHAATLGLDIPDDRVTRARWIDLRNLPRAVQAWRKRRAATPGPARPASDQAQAAPAPRSTLDRALRRARELYVAATCVPDESIGWYPSAVAAGKRMTGAWRPDIVFASAPPFTTLLIGRRLARHLGVPWVAEYRDRFLEDPYSRRGAFVRCRDKWLEDRWLRGVAGIVTVSEPWAADYRARLGVPVATVLNGFDPDDFPAEYPRKPGDPAVLRIVYTGILYPERRDPSPLFAAMARLPEPGAVRAEFYGAAPAALSAMAARHGVTDRVAIHGRVPYRESIDLQMNADVLLLLQWNDPRERGNVPGKLFEYLGARRPVLGIGVEDGVPARVLAERGAGIVLNDPDAIAARLQAWIAEKRAKGAIPLLPMVAREGQARDEQYAITERLLEDVVARRAKP